MKITCLLLALFIAPYLSVCQELTDDYSLGNSQQYFEQIQKEVILKGKKIALAVSKNKSYAIDVYTNDETKIIGRLQNKGSVLSLFKSDSGITGHLIVSREKNIVYKYQTDKNGILNVFPTDIHNVLCHNFHPKDETKESERSLPAELLKKSPYELESKPGAKTLIMVDMDGYELPSGTVWNRGNSYSAKPVGWSDDKLKLIWSVIADDFAPFDVNVTTKESLWSNYSKRNRQRIVINRGRSFSGSGDGVAQIGSFGSSRDHVCWMWMNDNYTTISVGSISSHEVGHTLGLFHQGGTSGPYYLGTSDQGHDGWVPIMGSVTRKKLSQWSKSEFSGATRNQDDLAIMARTINYITDDHANSLNEATALKISSEGDVSSLENIGLITTRKDVDYFKFTSGKGALNLTIKPRGIDPSLLNKTNLDLISKLYAEDGTLVATAETGHKRLLDGVNFNIEIKDEGTYYIEVDGYGTGNPITGYSDYGSLGPYAISGKITPKIEVVVVEEEETEEETNEEVIEEVETIEDEESEEETEVVNEDESNEEIEVETVEEIDEEAVVGNETAVENEEVEENKVIIYPNPTNGILNITGIKGSCEYFLYNNLGQFITKGMFEAIESDFQIPLQIDSKGFYFLKLVYDNNTHVEPIIVN